MYHDIEIEADKYEQNQILKTLSARSAAAAIGGRALYAKHGSVHMEAIGRSGFWTTVERYYAGDPQAYMAALRSRNSTPRDEFDPRLGCKVRKSA